MKHRASARENQVVLTGPSEPKIAAEIKVACEGGQAARAGAAAHKLKASARAIGALALGNMCGEIEQAGRSGQIEMLATLLPGFELEMAAVEKHLDSLHLNIGATKEETSD